MRRIHSYSDKRGILILRKRRVSMFIIEGLINFFCIITGLVEIIRSLLTVCTAKKRKRQLINLLYRTMGKENERRNVVDFYNYVKPRLNIISPDSAQISDYNVKMLKKDLKPNASQSQMVFILGDPGSGKSTLMLHLAFWYCSYNNPEKKISPIENLIQFGILYCRMRDYQSLDELKKELDNGLEALFLDGFDEFIVMQNKTEEAVLEELLSLLLENKSNIFRKVYISSRKELFKSSLKKILAERNLKGHQPQIIEICPFNRTQILSLYKKKGKERKGRNQYKMRRYLSEHETIFRLPLLIEYADIIMKEFSGKEFLSLGQALNVIVKDWIRRENELWHSRQGIGKKWDQAKQSAYEKNAWKFILTICQHMVQVGSYNFSVKDIEIGEAYFDDKFLESQNRKFFFSTRQLIHKINEEKYEFIHSLFFEFFVARLLVSIKSVTFEQKKLLLSDSDRNYNIFYAYWLKELPSEAFDANMYGASLVQKLERTIDEYVVNGEHKYTVDTVEQLCALISAEGISLNKEPEITVHGILWLFPLVEGLKWRSYQLSLSEIEDLMGIRGNLALTDGRLKKVSDLQSFFPFRNLDIRNNNITNLEQIGGFDSLNSLCLYGNRLESIEPLTNIKISKLEISIWDEKNLDELFLMPECNCFIDLPDASPLYIKLEQIQASNTHWHLAFIPNLISFRQYYVNLPYGNLMSQIMKAAFHLILISFCTEKHFEPAAFDFGNEIGKCLYIEKKYSEAIEIFKCLMSAAEKAQDTTERILLKIKGWMGQIFAKTGDYERAVPLLEYACGKQWKKYADNEMQIMWYWLLVSLYRKNGKINIKDYGIVDIFRAMYSWGIIFYQNQQYEDAEEVFNDLYQKRRETLGQKSLATLNTQLWLGIIFYHENNFVEAEKMLGECYEKTCEAFGENHIATVHTQAWLGMTFYHENKYDDAEKMLAECHKKSLNVIGEKHTFTLDIQHWIDLTLNQKKKLETEM